MFSIELRQNNAGIFYDCFDIFNKHSTQNIYSGLVLFLHIALNALIPDFK